MFWCMGAELMMVGIVDVGSAVHLDPIACAVWRD